MKNRTIKYGWKPSKPDARDYRFERLAKLKVLPTTSLLGHIYLRRYCSQVTDQGNSSTCTGQATVNLLEFNEIITGRGGAAFQFLSRLFPYFNARVVEGDTDQDAGAEIRDVIKTVATQGICLEKDWPFQAALITTKPPATCYASALTNIIHSYYALTTVDEMRACLAASQAIVGGIQVYDSFESDAVANTGVVPLPAASEQLLGGHAILFMGYNDAQQRFLCKNSWGTGWGLKGELAGYFTIPYAYIANPALASDFWTIVRNV